jgi:hypothetical protein
MQPFSHFFVLQTMLPEGSVRVLFSDLDKGGVEL